VIYEQQGFDWHPPDYYSDATVTVVGDLMWPDNAGGSYVVMICFHIDSPPLRCREEVYI